MWSVHVGQCFRYDRFKIDKFDCRCGSGIIGNKRKEKR